MRKNSLLRLIGFLICLCFTLSACDKLGISSKEQTTLTIWHVYGAQTYSPMNTMIEKFNQTVGKENGVQIIVSSVSNSAAIHDSLVAAGKNEAGAPELPDLFVCYPKTLEAMGKHYALDWKKYFSKDELDTIVPEFIEEGMFDDKLLVFPIAKSSNSFTLNADLFEQFAKATNHSYADLKNWESFFKVTEDYYKWSGGKSFFMHDSWIQHPMISMASFGTSLFRNNDIDWDNLYFDKVMRPLIRAGIRGEVCLMSGFTTKAIMVDEAVGGIMSTASILYFKDHVTHKDNSKTPLRLQSFPIPYFEGASQVAIQRGTGLIALKSTEAKEKAAALFCKWITSQDINLEFTMQGGYWPVRKTSFDKINNELESFEFQRDRYKSLYQAISKIYKENSLMPAPTFTEFGELEIAFPIALCEVLEKNKAIWLSSLTKDEAFLKQLTDKAFIELKEAVYRIIKERA